MSQTRPATPSAAAPNVPPGETPTSGLAGDWPTNAADTVERVVDSIRTTTAGPAVVASRVVVYGLVGAVLAIIALVLLLALLMRVLDVLLPREVWLPDLVIGVLLGLVGVLLWRKRRQPAAQHQR